MRKLSLIIIFVSVIILNVYLNYRIEYLTKSEYKSLIERNVKRLKSDELKNKINDLNNECKDSGGIENKKCRKKYLDFCIENADYHGENAEDNGSSLCTLYNKDSSKIFVSLCGRAYGETNPEKMKQRIKDRCNRPIDMADGDYINTFEENRIKQNFDSASPSHDSSAFYDPELKNNNIYDNCNIIRNKAKSQWEKKNEELRNKKLNLNKDTYNYLKNELKKTKPTNCSMFKEYSGVPCDSCDGCMWVGDECVEK